MCVNKKIIDIINASMSMSDLNLSEDDILLLELCLKGERAYDECVDEIVSKYLKKD